MVHGINSGPAERAKMGARLVSYLTQAGVDPGTFSTIAVAEWRSLGSFMGDLIDLKEHPVRWMEAVSDVEAEIHRTLLSDERILVVAHSMGQPIAVSALAAMSKTAADMGIESLWERCELITLGGPMGNPWARPYFAMMDQSLWATTIPSVSRWDDLHHPGDPICGAFTYEAFRAATAHSVADTKGTPVIEGVSEEHAMYFACPAVFAAVSAAAGRLSHDDAPAA